MNGRIAGVSLALCCATTVTGTGRRDDGYHVEAGRFSMRRVILAVGPLLWGITAPLQDRPFNQRPAEAIVVMGPGQYAGTYKLTEVAKVCGEVPADLNFSGVPAFGVTLYPDGGGTPDPAAGAIVDVSFDSKELVGKVTTSANFFLSLSLTSPKIGRPPKYVLDTSKPKNSGTATLTMPSPGTLQLRVKGADDFYGTVDLTLTCGPRKREVPALPKNPAFRRAP